LAIWDDTVCPDFSATRAIMLWIALSGIKTGYLFPLPHWFQDGGTKPGDPIVTEHMEYSSYLAVFKRIIKTVLGQFDLKKYIVGTHTMRRTAFLLAYWGYYLFCRGVMPGNKDDGGGMPDMEQASMCSSARHKSVDSTRGYLSDSATLAELHKVLNGYDSIASAGNKVGPWASIFIETDNWQSVNVVSESNQRPLVELSRVYLREILEVSEGTKMTLQDIHRKAIEYVPPATKKEQLLQSLEQAGASPDLLKQLCEVIKAENDHLAGPVQVSLVVAAEEPPAAKRSRVEVSSDSAVQCSQDFKALTGKLRG
jgi:hypothetical protein